MNMQKGVNLGGWLSQYDVNEPARFSAEQKLEHFKSFTAKDDIKRIAGWGADHIRLPIDGEMLLGSYREQVFSHIGSCIDWCRDYGLDIILDVHEIRGHVFGPAAEAGRLLTDDDYQQRLAGLWEDIASRYKDVSSPGIVLELLNEISDDKGGYAWNRLCAKLIDAIRKIDTEREILVGSNLYNSVFELNALNVYDDPNVLYGFHFYEPIFFTHQKAHFNEEMRLYNRAIHYPGTVDGFTDFLIQNPKYADRYARFAFIRELNMNLLEKLLEPALHFSQAYSRKLYCGEFGVIDNASSEDACNYCRDLVSIFRKFNIGYGYWNYKEMDFGLVNKAGDIVSPDLVPVLFQG